MTTNAQAVLERLNLLPAREAENELLKCCGSKSWAQRMASERPFASLAELVEAGEQIWWALESADWLGAFHSHPKIGEQKTAAKTALEAQRWSEDEQSGIRDSAEQTIAALAELNRTYEEKFGYIFIVCASGKSSEAMLRILRQRLGNNPKEELRLAAAEQAKITALRLGKLIEGRQI